MNGEYDGSITIKTAIDTSGFVAGEKDLAKSAQDAVGKIEGIGDAARRSLERQVENFSRMNDAYRQQAETVEQLRAQLDELRETEVMTPEAEAIIDEYKRTGEQLDKVAAKMRRMEEAYGSVNAHGRASFKLLQYDAETLGARYEELGRTVERIAEDDKYWKAADTTLAEGKLALAEEKQALMLDRLNSKYKDLCANVTKASETTTKAHKQMGEEGEKAFDRVTKKSSLSFKNILKYVVGVQTIYAMFNKIKRAASEGLQIVAQYDPQFNAVMSTLKTGISQLKADIGTMLQPILQTVVPILNMVLERLHNALMKVANVIAAIMGQDYIDVVTVKTENYAGALNDVATSAKKASKALGGYDKLQVIQTESAGGFSSMANATQAVGKNLDGIGENVDEIEKKAVKLGKIGKSIVGTIEEGFGVVYEYQEAFENEGILGVGKNLVKNLKYVLDNQQWIQIEPDSIADNLIGTLKESVNVVGDYVDSFEDEGLKGILKKFGDNFWEVIFNQEWVDASVPEWLKSENAGKVRREFTEEDRLRKEAKEVAETAQKAFDKAQLQIELTDYVISGRYDETKRVIKQGKDLIKGVLKNMKSEYLKNGGVDIAEDMSNALKSGKEKVVQFGVDVKNAMKKLGKTVPKVADIVTEPKSKAEIQSSLSKTFKTVGSVLQTGAQKLGRVFTGFFNLDSDEMTDKITAATTSSGSDPRVNEAATAVGKQISASIMSAVDFTDTDTNTVTSRTKKLISGADSVKLEAKKAGESVANSLAQGIKAVTAFSEADGKSTANQIAKGMEAVSAEANRGGSALSNALNSVGRKISEGINKGVISVPVTFTGKATPTGIGTQLNKINTTVTITLDGKVISETVFDNAEAIVKQKGSGARAGIHYVFGV